MTRPPMHRLDRFPRGKHEGEPLWLVAVTDPDYVRFCVEEHLFKIDPIVHEKLYPDQHEPVPAEQTETA